jgi:16S rRNA (uracil1498-N3)-methyltransferase
MSAPRFFLDAPLALGTVALPERVAHHALRVLRLREEAPLVLFNGRGGEFSGHLQVRPAPAAVLSAFADIEREAPLAITVLQAQVASDKLDWIVEKLTELGVVGIVIAPAERSVVRLQAQRLQRRLAHWREIVTAACAQCGRNRLPQVEAHETLAGALAALPSGPRRVLVPTASEPLASREEEAPACTLAIGPEGGFSDTELLQLEAAAFEPARLGPRVLRTETAALAAVAALQARAGDLR